MESEYEVYSMREKRKAGEIFPDVYEYYVFPSELKVQIWFIVERAFGEFTAIGPCEIFDKINSYLCEEYGVFSLTSEQFSNRTQLSPIQKVSKFFFETIPVEKALDVVESIFRRIYSQGSSFPTAVRYGDHLFRSIQISPNEAIKQLNTRLRQHGMGYQFEAGRIIKMDSQIIHSEIVQPVVNLLSNKEFATANSEFLNAHGHYRQGRYDECVVECVKAFESCLKTICDRCGLEYGKRDTASRLVEIVAKGGVVPSFTQNALVSLSTIGNNTARHGSGKNHVEVTEELAAYSVHLTATNLLFLMQQSQSK